MFERAFPLLKPSKVMFDTWTMLHRREMWMESCLVPVRRLSRPSRSTHFGDVSETNALETKIRSHHVTRNASAARNNEA